MKMVGRLAMCCAVLSLAVSGGAYGTSPMLKELEADFVKLHEEVRPCVVNIDTKGSLAVEGLGMDQLDDLFRFFGIPNPQETPNAPRRRMPVRQGTGSGFIYDKQGHIITNNHVVESADQGITVRLWDGTEYEATVVGGDTDTDVAVIKIEPDGKDLPVAKLGDSDALKVGQYAIALGSPRGFEGSLSFGHISALGRNQLQLRGLRFQDFIQTDAAINLGNSGGPLCNIDGEVIGMNIAIVYGANSLGFAIPINTAKSILPELISQGKVTRGYLGVQIVDARQYADALGMPDVKGAFVKQVQPDTPAERGDLKSYDVIRKVNGEVVEDANDLIRKISSQAPGATVGLEVWRAGESIGKEVELAEWEGETPQAPRGEEVLGLRVQTLTSEIIEHMRLDADTQGVVVIDVEPGSAADDAGIAQGDVITHIAQKPVRSADDFHELMAEHAKPGKSLLIGFIRGDGESDITILKVPKEASIE